MEGYFDELFGEQEDMLMNGLTKREKLLVKSALASDADHGVRVQSSPSRGQG